MSQISRIERRQARHRRNLVIGAVVAVAAALSMALIVGFLVGGIGGSEQPASADRTEDLSTSEWTPTGDDVWSDASTSVPTSTAPGTTTQTGTPAASTTTAVATRTGVVARTGDATRSSASPTPKPTATKVSTTTCRPASSSGPSRRTRRHRRVAETTGSQPRGSLTAWTVSSARSSRASCPQTSCSTSRTSSVSSTAARSSRATCCSCRASISTPCSTCRSACTQASRRRPSDWRGRPSRVLGAQGTFVATNNVVSQSVPHLHLHVVPRTKGDGLRGFFWPRTRYASAEESAEYAARLAAALGPAVGRGPTWRHRPIRRASDRLHSHPESANNGVSTLHGGVTDPGRMPRGWVPQRRELGESVPSVAGDMRTTTHSSRGRNHPNGKDHCF